MFKMDLKVSVGFNTLVKIKLVQILVQFKPADKRFCSSYCSQFKDKYHSKLFCCYSVKSAQRSLFTVFTIIPPARLYVRIVGCAPKRNVSALRNRSDDVLTDCGKPNKRNDREHEEPVHVMNAQKLCGIMSLLMGRI